jgi:hypothetical protein
MEYLIKLSNKIIKAGCDNISKPLAYILNISLTQGILPDRLKYSIMKPIYKNGDKAQILNYRSTSLLRGF